MIGTLLAKPLELMEDNFRRPTGRAGRLFGNLMAVQHRSLTLWAIEHMDVRSRQRVLDVGCGGGMAVNLLSRRTGQGFTAGVDYSMEMVEQAVRRNRAGIARSRVEVRHGDCAALPYEDSSFDQVCAIETFYFWPDPLRGLAEAHRVLKPGGQVSITLEMSREAGADPSLVQRVFGRRFTERSERAGLHILSGDDLVDSLTKAGFRDARFVSRPRRSLGWVCALAHK